MFKCCLSICKISENIAAMQKNQIKFIAARQNRSVYSSTNEKNTGKTHKCSFTAGCSWGFI